MLTSRTVAKPTLRLVAATVCAAAALAATGCGDERPAVSEDEQAVRTAVRRYGDAVATKDVARICEESLAPTLANTGEEVGLTCKAAFTEALKVVRGARLRIDGVKITKDTALVKVHTTAIGQPASDDTLKLMRAGAGEAWRITSLSTASSGSGGEKEPADAEKKPAG